MSDQDKKESSAGPADEKKPTTYKPTGKWAGEAFDFLRLFYRVGDQVTGLILIEISWAIFLVLLARLGPENTVRIIGIPWIESGQLAIRDVRLTSVFIFGAILIAFIWFLSSGLYLYITVPLQRIARNLALVLLQLLFVLFGAAYLPFYFILQPIHNYLISKKFKELPPEKQKDIQDQIAESGLEFKVAIRKALSKDIKLDPLWPIDKLDGPFDRAVTALMSRGYIGLASLNSYTFNEERLAIKAPMQIFASAIEQLRFNLHVARSTGRVRFQILPPIIKIHTNNRARFVRKWLGYDAIVWGSYLNTDSSLIWLNLEHALDHGDFAVTKNRDLAQLVQNDPFHSFARVQISPSLVIDQEDPLDAYIALLLAFVSGLQARKKRRFFLGQSLRDEIYTDGNNDEFLIITHLVQQTLFDLKPPLPQKTLYVTAKDALLDLAGRWLSRHLGGSGYLYAIGRDRTRPSHHALREVAARCAMLAPENPYNYYRLAACEYLVGDAESAEKAVQLGLEKDSDLKWLDSIRLYVVTKMTMLQHLHGSSDKDELIAAKLFVYLNRAIACGGQTTKEHLREDFTKTLIYALHNSLGQAITQSEQLIYKTLDLPLPSRDSQS
ncbi:MAG: hypothetical protein KBE23_06630 [Chloroflexi bacterium]|nr:hypothetical protein [Chloroflexota bacterium]MBP7042401.1 hypothetical protein [Chloroflexota bacterium]